MRELVGVATVDSARRKNRMAAQLHPELVGL
jgi:hypothetical protein